MQPVEVTVISCKPSKKRIDNKYDNFDERIRLRRRGVEQIYEQVEKTIFKTIQSDRKDRVYDFAMVASRLIAVKVDYILKRRREGMIIWFCENWDKVMRVFPDIQQEYFNIIYNITQAPIDDIFQGEVDLQPYSINENSLLYNDDLNFDF